MQFEVNGRMYFLNFVPGEGRWFVLTPARAGFEAVAVVDDDACMLFHDGPTVGPSDSEIVN